MKSDTDAGVAHKESHVNTSLRQTLTKEMLEEVQATFDATKDISGSMPYAKLNIALKALGMSLSEVDEVKIPTDYIDFDKFIEIVLNCSKSPGWASNELNESFCQFDKDGNGYIDPGELRRVFQRLGETLLETELEDSLREFDMDGDLKVRNTENFNPIATYIKDVKFVQ